MGIMSNPFRRAQPDYEPGVRDTSVEAFEANQPRFRTMGDRILHHMRDGGIYTRGELARDLNISTSTMSGRVNELLRRGKLREVPDRVLCSITGNRVRGLIAA